MLYMIIYVISNLYISPLIFHQQIFSVSPDWLLILKIIGQCDIKHTMTFPIKTITLDLKVSTYIAIITARPIISSVTLAVMFVSTFKTAVILYVFILAVCTTFYKCSFITTSSIFMYCLIKSYYFLYTLNTI